MQNRLDRWRHDVSVQVVLIYGQRSAEVQDIDQGPLLASCHTVKHLRHGRIRGGGAPGGTPPPFWPTM